MAYPIPPRRRVKNVMTIEGLIPRISCKDTILSERSTSKIIGKNEIWLTSKSLRDEAVIRAINTKIEIKNKDIKDYASEMNSDHSKNLKETKYSWQFFLHFFFLEKKASRMIDRETKHAF